MAERAPGGLGRPRCCSSRACSRVPPNDAAAGVEHRRTQSCSASAVTSTSSAPIVLGVARRPPRSSSRLGEVAASRWRSGSPPWAKPTMNRFGKPWTWMPCSARIPSAQCSESVSPSRPIGLEAERRVVVGADLEARREDQAVELVVLAADPHAGLVDPLDALAVGVDEVHVRAGCKPAGTRRGSTGACTAGGTTASAPRRSPGRRRSRRRGRGSPPSSRRRCRGTPAANELGA